MKPLEISAIHARRRPVAIATMFVAELAWALVVATPVHEWARRAWGSHPDGDAVLFVPGGRDLLVWLGQEDAGLSVTARTTVVLLLVGALLLQLPFGALVASLAFGREGAAAPAVVPAGDDAEEAAPPPPPMRSLRMGAAWKVGVGAWLPLTALLAFSAILTVIVLSLGGIVSSLVEHSLTESLGDARSFTARIVVFALFAAIAAVLGIVVDLARAAVVREIGIVSAAGASTPAWSTMLRGLRTAMSTARRALGRATLGWAGRAVVGVALIAIGYVAASTLGGRGGAALTGLFVIHQGIVLGRVALRASWMARAVALVAPVQDEREAQRAAAAVTSER
jgi:hypothetical protein